MTPNPSPTTTVHRLLFRALLEIREQGYTQQNKLIYYLADLFHNVVLEMESAAEGEQSFDDVLRLLSTRAQEKGLDRWLNAALSDLSGPHTQPTA